MGIVFRARDTKLDRLVALKTLSPHLHYDETAKRRFIQEAQAASALDHTHISTVHDIGETADGTLYIVMAHYEGETLKHLLAEAQFSVERCLEIGIQLASALERAHEAGIVHRDLKPANVQVTERGEAKLLDFGVAKLASGEKLTNTGATLGTVGYSSPEQIEGVAVDHRTDLWALGVVLYEMLSGTNPFKKSTSIATTTAVLHTEPEPLDEVRPNTPPDAVDIIMSCLSKAPSGRPQDAVTVRRALEQARAVFHGVGEPMPAAGTAGLSVGRASALMGAAVTLTALIAWLLLR